MNQRLKRRPEPRPEAVATFRDHLVMLSWQQQNLLSKQQAMENWTSKAPTLMSALERAKLSVGQTDYLKNYADSTR